MLESQKKGIQDLERLQGLEYEYRLENYASSLSELTFRAHKIGSQEHFYRITFQTTLYIQTATHWDRGNFELAIPEKHIELTDALGLNAAQREQLLLFVASPSNRPKVLVLCHQVFVSQEIPLP
jgi:hypothetical protein